MLKTGPWLSFFWYDSESSSHLLHSSDVAIMAIYNKNKNWIDLSKNEHNQDDTHLYHSMTLHHLKSYTPIGVYEFKW